MTLVASCPKLDEPAIFMSMQRNLLTTAWTVLAVAGLVSGQEGVRPKQLRRDLEATAPSLHAETKIALLVGIGDYDRLSTGLNSLHYPVSDVGEISKILNAQGYLVSVLTDRSATSSAIRDRFAELTRAVDKSQGSFLFFFSGHGFRLENQNYLATFGTQATNMAAQGVSLEEIQKLLVQTGARQRMAFIDACRNDPNAKAVGGARSFADLKASEGLRVLYSTAPGQFSYEDDTLQEGVFTHFLVEGLKGQAAAPDGLVTFDDLNRFVTREMRRYGVERGRVQIPYQLGENTGDFLVAVRAANAPAVAQSTPPPQPQRIPQTQPPAPTQNPQIATPAPSSGGPTAFGDTEKRGTLTSGSKKWRSTVDNQVYHMQFDAQTLVIRTMANQIVATLSVKAGKKGKAGFYSGSTGLFPANRCPGGQGVIEIRSWNENRIDGRVLQPTNSNGQISCAGILGWNGLSTWTSWTWIAEPGS